MDLLVDLKMGLIRDLLADLFTVSIALLPDSRVKLHTDLKLNFIPDLLVYVLFYILHSVLPPRALRTGNITLSSSSIVKNLSQAETLTSLLTGVLSVKIGSFTEFLYMAFRMLSFMLFMIKIFLLYCKLSYELGHELGGKLGYELGYELGGKLGRKLG